MAVWSTSTPAGSDSANQGDDRIREAKVAIEEALRGGAAEGDEAVFPGVAPLTAPIFRYRGLKGTTAARPAASAGGLYHNTTTGTFQRSNGSTWDELTENAAFEAIHAAVAAANASVLGVVTLTEVTNAFNVTGTEAVTSIAGWSAGIAVIRWASERVLTHHATNLILVGGVTRTVRALDISIFEFTGTNTVREIGRVTSQTPRTTQYLTSGTTYTTPVNCRRIIVKMLGAGGGGGADQSSNGVAGGNTSFNSIVANGGAFGQGAQVGALNGAGGTGGAGSAALRIAGRAGAAHANNTANYAGASGPANSGVGGMGGNYASGPRHGGGGGFGEYVEFTIADPVASYIYAIGAGGAGGTDTGANGGAGGSGLIIVEEYF